MFHFGVSLGYMRPPLCLEYENRILVIFGMAPITVQGFSRGLAPGVHGHGVSPGLAPVAVLASGEIPEQPR